MTKINYPLIFVLGSSGTGKSYSMRNMPPDRTLIISPERKPLPFKNAFEFIKLGTYIECSTVQEFDAAIIEGLNKKEIDYIVIESISKYFELLMGFSRKMQKGYEIFNLYNSRIEATLEALKGNDRKVVIVQGIDEILKFMSPTGDESSTRRAKVQGKVWEGQLEKEFAVVLFTDVKQEKGKMTSYRFMFNNDGTNSAKSPPGMFSDNITEQYMDNDLKVVCDKVMKFYGLKLRSEDGVEFFPSKI